MIPRYSRPEMAALWSEEAKLNHWLEELLSVYPVPPHVELVVKATEPGVRGDTASGGATKAATLETGLEIRVPLFIKENDRVKVHTETREFAGRA